jgi:hypothetical protein
MDAFNKDNSNTDISKDILNFDSISEIGGHNISMEYRKNTSFYSLNEGPHTENTKQSKKVDLDAVKLLPAYIDRVNQNIKILENLIGSSSRDNSRVEHNTSVNHNDRAASSSTSPGTASANIFTQTHSQRIISTVKPVLNDFAVIEERDEDLISRTSILNDTRKDKTAAANRVGIKKLKLNEINKNTNFTTLNSKTCFTPQSPKSKINSMKKMSVSNVSLSGTNTTIDVKKLKNCGESGPKTKRNENSRDVVNPLLNSIQGAINSVANTLNTIGSATASGKIFIIV